MKHRAFSNRFSVILFLLAGIVLTATRAFALEPDEIALVVNSNVPEGLELAKFYALQRNIPNNRILVLDLPKGDEITCRQFEDQVVPQVRDFLHSGQLEAKIKCLVTFYGVPLRISPRVDSNEEGDELTDIRKQLIGLPDQMRPALESVETLAQSLNPDFKPDPFGDLDHLAKRKSAAFNEVSKQLAAITDKGRQLELLSQFLDASVPLTGDKAKIEKMGIAMNGVPVDQPALAKAVQEYNNEVAECSPLEKLPDDAESRRKLREIVSAHFGLMQYLELLRDQADYLNPTDSGAAFDSELAMTEWLVYPHKGFSPNPLFYSHPTRARFRTLMVSRLDAPQPETVKSMITTGIKVEQTGLTGKIVIDSLGVEPGKEAKSQAGYGQYDQYLRDLHKLLTDHTTLVQGFDDKPEVLPPGSFDNVALYVGWYSVHNYVPCCKFVPGAVGYHIASYELISLHKPGESGWVHGLLNDGVVGTLGPVAEPFLGTFPHPDDFFPLLLTGKLSYAEVYWTTCPAVSWMMTCVGDPLYTPYAKNPVLKEEDLPFRLHQAINELENPQN